MFPTKVLELNKTVDMLFVLVVSRNADSVDACFRLSTKRDMMTDVNLANGNVS